MAWTKLHLSTTTPVFNTDGRTDQAEIRVPSVRGAMRFWLRALIGALAGSELSALHKVETRVLGAASTSSPVSLRIPHQPASSTESRPDFLTPEDHNRWIGYMLGPGLTSRGDDKANRLERAFIPAGKDFDLWVRFRSGTADEHATALAALWLALTYGGIGARTRRGFGGIRINGVSGPLPDPWGNGESMRTPGLDHYRTATTLWFRDALQAARPAVERTAEKSGISGAHTWQTPPDYPALSNSHTVAAASRRFYGSWQEALAHAGEALRAYRSWPKDNEGWIERPEWFDTIKDGGPDDREFQIGAFGLPLVLTRAIEAHADRTASTGVEKLRRASPLWIRPVAEDRQWHLFSFGFLTEFLPEPDAPGVHLWRDRKQGKLLEVTTEDAHSIVREWVAAFAEDRPPVRRLPDLPIEGD